MKIERDEDTFAELKEMGEDIHLVSRNYNHEIIGIEYYANFDVLTKDELTELEAIWRHKTETCLKEKLASQWMLFQVIGMSSTVSYIAWVSAGKMAGVIAGVLGLLAFITMVEDNRIRIAKRNLADSRKVYRKILDYYNNC